MKRKQSMIAIAGLALVAIVGSSFAYWSMTAETNNNFETGDYGSTIIENFKPEDGEEFKPGDEVNKDVMVQNTGDAGILVRVKLDETWTKKGETTPYKENTAESGDVYTVSQDNATDGLTAADKSVVEKIYDPSTNWIDGGDGWYYYKTVIGAGETSDNWLSSVKFMDTADLGVIENKTYVTAAEDVTTSPDTVEWVEYTGKMPAYVKEGASGWEACEKDDAGAQPVLNNKTVASTSTTAGGYGKSEYVLTVTTESIQASQEAVDAVFGGGAAFTAPAGTDWALE